MELFVENIGKIDKARIEVNGMTVITGYNGTGKSSLCRSLYSIMKTFSNINQKVFEQRKNSLMSMIYNWEEHLLDDGLEQENCEKMVIMLMDFMEESQDLEEEGILSRAIEDISKLLNITIKKETINILQKKYKDIVKKDKDEYMRFIIARNIRDIFRNQMAHVNYKNEKSMIELKDEHKIWNIVYEANALAGYTYKYSTLKEPVYIEPQSVLDRFRSRPFGQTSSTNIQRFLMKDSREDLTLEEYQERQKNLEIIHDILQEITNGYLISGQNRNLFYSEKDLDEDIECSNIASGLKPFLIIQRLIENGALGTGRVLIIDEPEVNLHPEWQLAFAKILVLLNLKLNVRVVLSTHSPYFLRAIESYMKEYDNQENGKYYITVKQENKLYTLNDVTDNLERIYKTLYKPLEEIN